MTLESPYRGLAAFDDSDLDALYFFGRERDSEIVVANLIASRLTVLYGPSGVGKSSLLLASVARALRRLPEEPLVVVFSRWSEPPERALAATLSEAAGIEDGPLVDVATRAQSVRDVYLVLDQAEEYFTYHGGEDGFDEVLASLVEGTASGQRPALAPGGHARVARQAEGRDPGPVRERPPARPARPRRGTRGDREATRALERARGGAVTIEDALVDDVLDGVGAGRIEFGPGGLGMQDANGRAPGIEAPYLQLVMQRLWDVERSTGSTTLRASTLAGLGGAAQVVADHLERAIEALTPAQRDVAASALRAPRHPLGHEDRPRDVRPRTVRALHGWTTFVVSWASSPTTGSSGRTRPDAGRSSTTSSRVRCSGGRAVTTPSAPVARASADARRRHRRLAFLAFGALVALSAMTALAVFAFSQRSQARDQARSARSGQLVASALSVLDSDPELGIELALEAARIEPTARAENALRLALDGSRVRAVIPTGHPVVGMDVDPARPRVLAVGDDGVARLYRLDTGALLWSHRPVAGGAAAFLEGGRSVVLISGARLVTLDAATGRPRGDPVPVSLAGVVDELVPSPDGRSAIVLTGKPRARVIAISTGARLGRVKHPRVITDAAFSPDGRGVVSGGRDRAGRLWSTTNWREVMAPLLGHNGQVLAVAFDRAGQRIATGSTDQTARVWRARDGRLFTTLFGHTANVSDAAFGPGGVLVTASSDGTARTWRRDGVPARTLVGHRGPVVKAEFAADGSWSPGEPTGRSACGIRARASTSSSPRTLAGRASPSGERSRRTAARPRGPTGTSSAFGLLSASECWKGTKTP